MNERTLDQKTNFAAIRAREVEAEKHFYDLAQPFFPHGFSVVYRNPGHWDIWAAQVPGKDVAWLTAHGEGSSINGYTTDDIEMLLKNRARERAFRIRGEAPNVWVSDERWNPHRKPENQPPHFKSVIGAMLWIMEELMQEPTPPSGQKEG